MENESSPWMTRRQAAEYLLISVDTVDRCSIKLADHPERVKGKLRYSLLDTERDVAPIRILRADVFALLPLP